MEVGIFGTAGFSYFGCCGFEFTGHAFQGFAQVFVFRSDLHFLIYFADMFCILSGGDATDGSYYLQLGSTFVNIGDSGIPHVTLDRIVFHKS